MADDNSNMSSGSAVSYGNSDDAMYSEGEEVSETHRGEYRNEDEIADEGEFYAIWKSNLSIKCLYFL